MSKLEEEEGDDEGEKAGTAGRKRDGVYKPTRNVPQFFQDDKTADPVSEMAVVGVSGVKGC